MSRENRTLTFTFIFIIMSTALIISLSRYDFKEEDILKDSNQDIVEPQVTLDTNIITNNHFKTGDKVTINSEVNNNIREDGTCSVINNLVIISHVDTVLSDINNIKARYKDSYLDGVVYDKENNVIYLTISNFDCLSSVVLTYDSIINDSINNRLEDNIYSINTKLNINYLANNLKEDSKEISKTISSPKRIIVTSRYLNIDTYEEIADPIIEEIFYGDDYVTNELDHISSEYELDSIPNNASGSSINTSDNSIIVNYYYHHKICHVITEYINIDNNINLANNEEFDIPYGSIYQTNNDPSRKEFTNYDYISSSGITSGVAEGDVKVTYYYRIKKGTVTIRHIDIDTNEDLETPTKIIYNYYDNYHTSPKDNFSNYTYDSVLGIESGTVMESEINITYKYRKKVSEIHVNHIDQNSNKPITKEEVIKTYFGNKYETNISNNIPLDYELITKSNNFEGYANSSRIDVTYYYDKKDYNIQSELKVINTKEINDVKDKILYEINYTVNINDYIGDGEIILTSKLPYKLNIDDCDILDGVYNEEDKTITYVIPWNNIDSYKNGGMKTIVKKLSLSYQNIDSSSKLLTNSFIGTVKLNHKSLTKEEKVNTNVIIK